jgi:hypothetical protein
VASLGDHARSQQGNSFYQECQLRQTNDHDKHRKSSESRQKPAPTVISARMMQVYRDAQVEQHEQQMDEDGENEVITLEEEPNHSQSDNERSGQQ